MLITSCRVLCRDYLPLSYVYKLIFSVAGDKQPLPWDMRVRVAYYIAEALDHCNKENWKLYHDLNAYRVLFDEVIANIYGIAI